jgi:serine/threonine-protein kinase CTR1
MRKRRSLSSVDEDIDYSQLELESKPLGSGAFGIVYKAKYHGSDVAVKKINTANLESAKAVEDFKSEIAIMRQLRHPNIVLFMGAITESNDICIVTQYCNNGDLYNILHKKGMKYSLADILTIGKKIATGMSYLHGKNIVHRDLKSLNVLMDDNTPKIADFGISRMKKTESKIKTPAGTLLWMVTLS